LFATYKLHLSVTEVSMSIALKILPYRVLLKLNFISSIKTEASLPLQLVVTRVEACGQIFRTCLVTFLHILYFCQCSSIYPNVLLTGQHSADVPRSLSLHFTPWLLYRSEVPNIRTVHVNGAYNLLYGVTLALRVGRAVVTQFKSSFFFVTA